MGISVGTTSELSWDVDKLWSHLLFSVKGTETRNQSEATEAVSVFAGM